MKKIFLFLILFSLTLVNMELIINNELDVKNVMKEVNISSNESEYELDFGKENLNLANFKLKFANFTSYNYQIKKVYFDYSDTYSEYFNKEYFTFIGNNLNEGIDNLREQYLLIIKENRLSDDIDSITNNYISIKKVIIYTSEEAIYKFKIKYPNVKVDRIS